MKTNQPDKGTKTTNTARLPLAVKLAFTAFMAVLVPVYWTKYGPANFLYFCDLALILTLVAVWMENRLCASMAAVGIILPQIVLWCGDFAAHFIGIKFNGMTDYMFDGNRSLFLRGLSFFHGWLPFLLLYIVAKLGYDRRAAIAWTGLAWAAMLFSFFFLPAPGAKLANPLAAVNVDYVYGFSETAPQTWMPPRAWLTMLMVAIPTVVVLPTHLILKKLWNQPAAPVPAALPNPRDKSNICLGNAFLTKAYVRPHYEDSCYDKICGQGESFLFDRRAQQIRPRVVFGRAPEMTNLTSA